MCFVDQNVGYVVGLHGLVIKTSDAGATWDTLSTNSSSYLQGVNFYDANHGVVVGSAGEILYTDDGGINWCHQQSGTPNTLKDVRMLSPTSAIVVGDTGVILKNDLISSCSAAGIESNQQNNEVKIYPNPAQDRVNILINEDVSSIQIMDILGNILFSKSYNYITKTEDISLGSFVSGTYLIAIHTAEGKTVKKFIKK